jgi:hypothetical protein
VRGLGPGTTIGPYVLEAEIARGGMGAVFRARRAVGGSVVALKLLRTGGAASADQFLRFQREGQLAARLNHPGIVRVHDAGVVNGLPFIAMDLVDGEPLSASVGRLAPLEAARLVAQVARAIEHAHAHGVIHRDLKPDNVLVRRDDGRPVVTDFGIARDLESGALTKTGALVGTPHYMSPEQAKGLPATAACDVHALGVLLFEAITGVPPFRADDLGGLLVQITEGTPPRPGSLAHGVPRALDDLVRVALAKDPAARPSAAALAAALEAIAEGRGPTRRTPVRALVALALATTIGAALLAVAASPDAPVAAKLDAPPRVTTEVAPPPAPATTEWTEPPWLRALDARGVDALLAAHDALDEAPDLEPRTRARAVEVLARLDAAWTEPAASAADRADRLDALLWLQWLWRRVEPAHAPGDRAAVFQRHSPWRPSGVLDTRYMLRVARASIAVEPELLEHYVTYANCADALADAPRDVELLRVGMQLAARAQSDITFGMLARRRAEWLAADADASDPERARTASSALLALAREVGPEGSRAPTDVAAALLLAAARAPTSEALPLLDQAEALTGQSVDAALCRASVLARDPAREAEAAGLAEEALMLASMAPSRVPRDLTRAAALAADLHVRAGRSPQARGVLGRAINLRDGGPQAGLAMRLALLVADTDAHSDALHAALFDLTARLEEQLEQTRRRSGSRDAVARLTAALAAVQSVEKARTAPEVRAALAPWKDPKALEGLDP